MNIIRKIIISALLSLAAIGLTTSLPAFADGASDAALYCSGCHAGLTVNGVMIGAGSRACGQRTAAEWSTTIERMNGKGCGVPAGSIAGIASYLAGLGGATVPPTTCYDTWGGTLISYNGTCPTNTTSIPPPICTNGSPYLDQPFFNGSTWTCVPALICYNPDGSSFGTYAGSCPPGTSTTPPTSATTTTTTTTTLCNTYINGTTQFPYSGSGACHSFAIDDMSGAHIVRDQSYCKKHMSHFNSKGNHVHAYPHPACM